MTLTEKDLIALSAIAKEAALKSGKMIEGYILTDPLRKELVRENLVREELEVQHKNTGSSKASQVVTKVDLESQKIILDLLSPTIQQYDLGLLSEESVDDQSRFEKDYYWCIDPLDGTLAFTQSKPGFSVSIALVSKDGIPQIGVVYQPSTQTIYSAVKDTGVFKNGKPLKLKQIEKTEHHQETKSIANKLTIIAERNLMNSAEFKKITNELYKAASSPGWSELKIVEGGGAVFNACQVIENSPAIYFKLPKLEQGGGSSWDFAATSCLFNELTGTVSDVFGNQLDLNKKGEPFMNRGGVVYASEKSISTKASKIIQSILI